MQGGGSVPSKPGLAAVFTVAAVAAAVLVLAGAAYWVYRPAASTDCPGGSVAGAAIGGPFTLVDTTGATVTEAEVIDRPALVYFGYTFCPDVCPFDMARNADAVDLLAERGVDVKPVFITVDPARDTPQVLADYTGYLHPRMQGLTGTPEQVRAAADAYKVFYSVQDDDPEFYLMNHTSLTYLMLPGSGLAAFFRGAPGADGGGVTAEQMAETVACHLGG